MKNRTTEPLPAEGGGTGGTILEADPIVDAYKKNVAHKSDEEIDNAYTPPVGVINLDDDDDDDDHHHHHHPDGGGGDSNNNNGGGGGGDRDDVDIENEVGGCGDHDSNNNSDNANGNGDGGAATGRDDSGDGENADRKRTGDGDDGCNNLAGNENEEKTYRRVESTTVTSLPTTADLAEENKSNRDPRRKATTVAATAISQPPPPGMEDEFSPLAVVSKNDAVNSLAMGSAAVTDVAYTTQMPYAYASPYAAMIPPQAAPSQMYLTSAAVYSQSAASLPFAAMATVTANAPPPPQMYTPPLPLPLPPPTAMHRTDPSLIPLPIDVPDNKRSCEKRKLDDGKDDDSNDDRKSSTFKTFKKHKSYYTPDSKSVESAKSSPNR